MGKAFRMLPAPVILSCLTLSFFCGITLANSVWKGDSTSLYSAQKVFKEGDIITVLILESTTALSQAGTDTGVKDDLSLRYSTAVSGAGTSPRSEVGLLGQNKYTGTGKTSRASNIQTKIAALITKVLSNGNLAITGSHTVTINDERQDIKISGVIRPQDITSANTVYSFQVAQAEVSVAGEGTVSEAENPGWLTRVLNWLF